MTRKYSVRLSAFELATIEAILERAVEEDTAPNGIAAKQILDRLRNLQPQAAKPIAA